jgi:hypothetical protein
VRRPVVEVDLRPYFSGEQRGRHDKTLIVLHETVSHNQPGEGDIRSVARFMDEHGLEIHGIIDKEAFSGWAYDRRAIYDHAASGEGNINTKSVGFELVSEIPALDTRAERRAAWEADDRKRQLDELARWCAWLSTVEPIPLRFSNADRPGITTHWNVSKTWLGGEGHWDCWPIHQGGHFPALYVVNKAQQIRAAAEAV